MDNATHSLVGLLLAEAAILFRSRGGRASSAGFVASARWLSVVANNLGDLDSLYARRLGGKLGYLLQHRGYTHTVPVALGMGMLAWAVWLGMRRRALSIAERWWLLGLSLCGVLLHIAFDALNNYGVHPFWPWYDEWLYGDGLFIIEPWLWVFAVPALYPSLTARWGKRLLGALLVAGLLLSWALSIVPWGAALVLSLGSLGALRICYGLSAPRRLAFAGAGWALVLCTFLLASRVGQARVTAELGPPSGERLFDVVMTPAPANPLCFSVLTVSLRGDEYLLRAGRLSLVPAVLSAERCRVQPTGLTLGLQPPSTAHGQSVFWEGEWRGAVSELRTLDREHCLVHALLGFARAPFWQARGASWFIGDLRFDRDPDLDFDELEVPRPPAAAQCLPHIPPWLAPRRDLLEGRAR
ncbi:MAG: metal-dependent hydrolase [Polyangiaceae bacterium]